MVDVVDLVFGGAISLLILFMLTPTIANTLGTAVDSVTNTTGLSESQSALITSVLVLSMIVFFILILYAFYKAVDDDM